MEIPEAGFMRDGSVPRIFADIQGHFEGISWRNVKRKGGGSRKILTENGSWIDTSRERWRGRGPIHRSDVTEWRKVWAHEREMRMGCQKDNRIWEWERGDIMKERRSTQENNEANKLSGLLYIEKCSWENARKSLISEILREKVEGQGFLENVTFPLTSFHL